MTRNRNAESLGLCGALPARAGATLLLPMIRFENVTKTYKGSTVALRDITVEIEKGEFVFLVGASGSGKTTFIRLLLREELPDTGQILEAGRNIVELPKWRVPYLRRNIGCLFQDFRLLPNKSVFENVAFALEVIGRPRHVVANQVPQVLDLVGLANKRDNLPGELSGSGSPSPAPSSTGPSFCWPTSPRGTSTRRRARASCSCSTASTGPARPWWWPRTPKSWWTKCDAAS